MKLFIDYYDTIKQRLIIEKTQKIMDKIKKPYKHNVESFLKQAGQMKVGKTELAEDGTIRMYIEGEKEPLRMYPDINTVWIVSFYKRLIPLITESITSKGWIKRIITLLAIKWNVGIASKWFGYMYEMNKLLLKDEHYSQPVKEVRRVLKGRLDQNLIDALALIIEYDSAYRYRFQDIIVELNKDNLNKPAKEITRLIDILLERDWIDSSKWEGMKKLIRLALLSPKIKREVIAILRDINIDEVKFSKEDIYWTNKNKSPYLFRGMTFKEREAENKKNYGE